jgi:DNA-binding HxlR family transcriptional regulator
MKSSYGHFCLAARTLETVGDRWSLLIVRDLLAGPRRFGELRRLLTNVTAKWLSIRLRQLEESGIVTREQQPGRREVWYELTEKGRELAPVLDALMGWGLKYERQPLTPEEAAHPEHLVPGLRIALNEVAPKPPGRRLWRFEFDDAQSSFALAFDGKRWTLAENQGRADVVVSTTPRAWADFVTRPPAGRRLPSRQIRLSGDAERVAELVQIFQGQASGAAAAGS